MASRYRPPIWTSRLFPKASYFKWGNASFSESLRVNNRLISSILPFAILLVVILGCDAWADIKGKVVDENGKPIAGVKIVVNQGNSKVSEHETDQSGRIDVFD